MPERIQRKRTKGWRMPENTVYVGRGSKWGNPWRVDNGLENALTITQLGNRQVIYVNPDDAVLLYRLWVRQSHIWDIPEHHPLSFAVKEELAGKNLACWCPLDQPCHADVLLEIAN